MTILFKIALGALIMVTVLKIALVAGVVLGLYLIATLFTK